MLNNTIKILISNGVLAVIGLVNSLIFPLFLTTIDYATYQQYLLYVSYINICHLGIASGMALNYAGKQYSKIDRSRYKSEIYLLLIVLCSFSVLGVLLSRILGSVLVLYTSLTIFPQCIIASFLALYQAWERFTEYAIINTLPKFLLTILAIVMFFWGVSNGKTLIVMNIIIIAGVSLYCLIEFWSSTSIIKVYRVFSVDNLKTTWSGLLITLGNYVNLLFHSIDKQFVLTVYSISSFAFYTFAVSMQSVMMIIITALATSFFPRLAKEDIDRKYILRLKELLIIIGAYSGCAYFAISFVVSRYIDKYFYSLDIIAVFFAAFPAIAVINGLYINLYKIQRKIKKYIFTLLGMLAVAFLLNIVSVILHGGEIGISVATLICYYVWFFYSSKDFDDISITFKDIRYLLVFFVLYYSIVLFFKNSILGFVIYALTITIWSILNYNETLKYFWRYIIKPYVIRDKSRGKYRED